jgi:Na+/melibiose symporter-like transporter
VETDRYGWASAHTLGLAAVAVGLLAGFVVRQATATAPLLPLRMFRSRNVSGANLVQVLMVSALFGFQILIALYLQNVLGYGAAKTGLAMLPAAVMIAIVSLGLSARLNGRFGERNTLLAGIVLLIVAIGLLTRLPADASYVANLLPTMFLAGGFGLAISSLTTLGMSGAGAGDAGVVSGLFNTAQQVGGALGVAVLSTFAAGHTRSLLADGHDRASALTAGFHVAFGIGTALLVAAFVLTLTILRAPPAPVGLEGAGSPAA